MIKFDAFVAAIQEAITKANESLVDRHTSKFVEMYFDQLGDEGDLQEKLNKALGSLKGGQQSKEERIKAITDARDALSGGKFTPEKDHAELPGSYTPKLVSVQFPFTTEDGIEYRDVHIPLITLVPISSTEIKEVTLETDIVISESDDEVHLNFERKLFSRMIGNAKPGRLKIKVSPREPSEGLQIVVDGYEKLLRSQIPQ
jgi:hypothetical protein